MESGGDAETLGLQRNSQLKGVFNEAQQGKDCVQQCPGIFLHIREITLENAS